MASWIGLIILIVAGLALVLRGDSGSIGGLDAADFASLAAALALLIFIGWPALRSYSGRLSQGLKDAATWAALALVLVALYSFRDEFSAIGRRVVGELLPPGSTLALAPEGTTERAVRIRRRGDGHFVAKTRVNGAGMTLLVDTGASSVVLSQADARRAGIDLAALRYTVPVQTANGTSYAAPISLRNISVGPIVVNRINALVARPGALKESLLGMSFLTRLRSYEFSGDFLTLRI